VVGIFDNLVFFEYSQRQMEGVRSDAWRRAIFASYHDPMQDVYYMNPDLFNVMFSWQHAFVCTVYYLDGRCERGALRWLE